MCWIDIFNRYLLVPIRDYQNIYKTQTLLSVCSIGIHVSSFNISSTALSPKFFNFSSIVALSLNTSMIGCFIRITGCWYDGIVFMQNMNTDTKTMKTDIVIMACENCDWWNEHIRLWIGQKVNFDQSAIGDSSKKSIVPSPLCLRTFRHQRPTTVSVSKSAISSDDPHSSLLPSQTVEWNYEFRKK